VTSKESLEFRTSTVETNKPASHIKSRQSICPFDALQNRVYQNLTQNHNCAFTRQTYELCGKLLEVCRELQNKPIQDREKTLA
jgi:hypothetical protein